MDVFSPLHCWLTAVFSGKAAWPLSLSCWQGGLKRRKMSWACAAVSLRPSWWSHTLFLLFLLQGFHQLAALWGCSDAFSHSCHSMERCWLSIYFIFHFTDRELRLRESFWHTGGLGNPKYHRQDVWAPPEPCVLEELGLFVPDPTKTLAGMCRDLCQEGLRWDMKKALLLLRSRAGSPLGLKLQLSMPQSTRKAEKIYGDVYWIRKSQKPQKSCSCLLRLVSIGSA